jgi:hypothetical protein
MKESKHAPDTVDEIPTNPMEMPPPYWRSSGAVFHIYSSIRDLERSLRKLPKTLAAKDRAMRNFYSRYPAKGSWENEKAKAEWYKILTPIFRMEHLIKLSAQVACLMSAIEAEDAINCFCVYNLPAQVAEGIEKLSPLEKVTIASTLVGCTDIKGLKVYEGLKSLVSWRNAFAHGHCVTTT